MTRCERLGGGKVNFKKEIYCPKLKVFFNVRLMGGVDSVCRFCDWKEEVEYEKPDLQRLHKEGLPKER
jgi:hypothetical protein